MLNYRGALNMKTKPFSFEIWQGGVRVVEGEAPTQKDAECEMRRYLYQYMQDGSCEVKMNWKTSLVEELKNAN
jgi:hypothetical protein